MIKIKNIISIFDGYAIFFFITSLVFYFYNLSDWTLWQDEANYALLSKNILKFGYPYAYDGINAIWPNSSDVSPTKLYWIIWGWLPLYFNAFIFYLFGASTLTARFFSAFTGVLFIQYFYIIIKKITLSKIIARIVTLLLLFCLPLTLFTRQSGYYIFTVLFCFLIFYSYSFEENLKIRSLLFIIGSICLLNTHILIWGIMMTYCFIIALFKLKKYFSLFVINLLLSIPFIYFYQSWRLLERSIYHKNLTGFFPFQDRLIFFINSIFIAIISKWLILIIFIIFLFVYKKFSKIEIKTIKHSFILIALSIILAPLISRYIFFRYILFIIPILYLCCSIIMIRFYLTYKTLGGIFLAFFLCFQTLNIKVDSNGKYFSQLYSFLFELKNNNHDVNEGIIEYLLKHGKKTDTVLCPYGDFPIIFYTSMKVRGGPGGIGIIGNKQNKVLNIPKLENPDWIIMRKNWAYMYPNNEFENFLKMNSYKKIILNIEDTPWGNRPSPFYHFFITPLVKNPLCIYQLQKK